MTPHEIALATALGHCSYPPGSGWKRFARGMAEMARLSPNRDLSARQRHYMTMLAWRFRRQLPSHLVPETKPLDEMPPAEKRKKRPPSPEAERLALDDGRSTDR